MSSDTAVEVGRLYQPIKSIADVLTASQKDLFVRLPGLQGYWPMGIRTASGGAVEHSGTGTHLQQTGTCPTDYDGNSYVHLGDGTNYLKEPGVFGITGTETFIDVGLRGLTLGGWFWADETPADNVGLISRDAGPPERGYLLRWTTGNAAFFAVSLTGASVVSETSASSTTGAWHFVVGRFTPSAEVAIFLDGVKSANAVAVPASINVSTQAFEVGRDLADDDKIFHGRARDVFVCAAALSDTLIDEVRLSSVP